MGFKSIVNTIHDTCCRTYIYIYRPSIYTLTLWMHQVHMARYTATNLRNTIWLHILQERSSACCYMSLKNPRVPVYTSTCVIQSTVTALEAGMFILYPAGKTDSQFPAIFSSLLRSYPHHCSAQCHSSDRPCILVYII